MFLDDIHAIITFMQGLSKEMFDSPSLLMPLTILGIAKMDPAVIGHEGSTIVVLFNALRLLAYKQKSLGLVVF